MGVVAAVGVVFAVSVAACGAGDHGGAQRSSTTTTLHPVGAWSEIGSGTWRDVSWQLFRTNASDGGTCFAYELSPHAVEVNPRVPEEVPGAEDRIEAEDRKKNEYQGHVPGCTGASHGPVAEQALDVLTYQQDPGVTYHLFVGTVANDVSAVNVLFSDGTTQTIVPKGGAFLVAFPGTTEIREFHPQARGTATVCAFLRSGKSVDPSVVTCHA
jgi:hypothetical protein